MDAGADYIVTQMFFDNKVFFNFVALCRQAGIEVPIIPGIKILDRQKQLTAIPKNFFVNLPETLVEEIQQNKEHTKEIGINWSISQCEDLLNNGVNSIHFYILNDASAISKVLDKLRP